MDDQKQQNKQLIIKVGAMSLQKSSQPKQNIVRQSSTSHQSHFKAYILATLSSTSLVFMQITLKQLTKHFPPLLVLGVRGSLLFLFNFCYLYFSSIPVHVRDPAVFRAILKRALASAITMTMYLSSVKYIPIGVANALFNTTPIMTFFIEAVTQKKSIFSNSLNLLMTVISFIGVTLIIQPSFLFGNATPDNYIFYFVVLASAFTGSFSMIFLHELRKKVGELIVLQHGYLIQAVLCYFLYTFTNSNDEHARNFLFQCTFIQFTKLIAFMLLLVLFAFLTQYLQAKAMYMSTPALIMPFSYFSVIVGFIIDVLVLDAKYNLMKIIGMMLASFGLFSKFIVLYFDKKKTEKEMQIVGSNEQAIGDKLDINR